MTIKLKRLHDQVVVITGATSGIGLVTARKAAHQGARLVLAARSEEALSALASELSQAQHEATIAVADVGSFNDVQNIALIAGDAATRFVQAGYRQRWLGTYRHHRHLRDSRLHADCIKT